MNMQALCRLLPICLLLLLWQSLPAQHSSGPPSLRLNHIAFVVNDLNKSAEFYRQVLGLDTLPEPFKDGKHVWLNLGSGAQLHLIAGHRKASSFKENHVCFAVTDMTTFLKKLNGMAIPFESWTGERGQCTTRTDGVRQVYLQDPDGYWLEVNNEH